VIPSAPFRSAVTPIAAAWPTSPVRIDDLDGVSQEVCSRHWQHELLGEDVNLFRDLARVDLPAGTLRAFAGDPARSGRYRRFLRPLGVHDELRTVLRAGSAPWGSITLWRREGQRPFSPQETELVAPLVVEAYDLTAREQQIVQLIARGAGTAEIADELFLSRHTVRDHVKMIFVKAGVSSRGELVAKLFAEFYEPIHTTEVTRAHST
jgi:DNA-binding CsgD family transcriptional regulator